MVFLVYNSDISMNITANYAFIAGYLDTSIGILVPAGSNCMYELLTL